MAALAFDVSTGELIDLRQALEQSSREEVEAKYADRPNAYCCAECLRSEQDLTDAQLLTLRTSGLTTDSSFRRGGYQQRLDPETGERKLTPFRPTFFHTTRLLDENGEPVLRPCESDTSIHHGYCRWIASSGRGWLLGSGLDNAPTGIQSPRHVVSVMARYVKDPSHREPDISVLWANSPEAAKELEQRFDQGDRTIDWSLCSGMTAVEVQKSEISKPELIARTQDHLRHFSEVRWVFTKGNRPVPCRQWLADEGIPAFIIEEEADRSRILGVRELAPPAKTKTYLQQREVTFCLRQVIIFWLSQGCEFPEAHARAKADLADIKSGRHFERLSLSEKWLHQAYPSLKFDPKQIWLRHRNRQQGNN